MTLLEIHHPNGEVEKRTLSKSQPVSVGSHSSNDVCIDGPDVATLHCRFAWAKEGFEVTSAADDGVDVNGVPVRHAALKDGDVVRVGEIDLVVRQGDESEATEDRAHVGLRPITEDELPTYGLEAAPQTKATAEKRAGPAPRPKSQPNKTKIPGTAPLKKPTDDIDDDLLSDLLEDDDEAPPPEPMGKMLPNAAKAAEPSSKDKKDKESEGEEGEKTHARWRPRPVRPGEQDPLKSPLVLMLFGGFLVLSLTAGIFWFLIGRNVAENQFNAAMTAKGDGRYNQAIEMFETFLKEYPSHELAESARLAVDTTKIEQAVSGAAPNWKKALGTIEDFIKKHRNSEKFGKQHEKICGFSRTVALGSAESALRELNRDLLKVTDEAEALLERYSPTDVPPTQAKKRILAAKRKAEAAIRKDETHQKYLADMKKAVESGEPLVALDLREELRARYADLADETRVLALRDSAIEKERGTVKSSAEEVEAQTGDRPSDFPSPLTLVDTERAVSDATSAAGSIVVSVAEGTCFGIDSATGSPRWRRVLGSEMPFFPIEVTTTVSGLLTFDSRNGDLILVAREDGQIVWRQEIAEQVAGAPAIVGGQILLPTLANRLYKISLESGRITGRLEFSQPLMAPPTAMPDGERLAVAGDRGAVYTISIRPLECVAVSYTGHLAGSLRAPLLTMGHLVLLPENLDNGNCRLAAFDTRPKQPALVFAGEATIKGHVEDAPVLRGNQLFVSTTAEQITAFTISDDEGQEPLTSVGNYQAATPGGGDIFLTAGPENQLWVASNMLTRLRLEGKKLVPIGRSVQLDAASQPLESIGDNLFYGRHIPGGTTTMFVNADRQSLQSRWRAMVGTRIVAARPVNETTLFVLTEQGAVFDVQLSSLGAESFAVRPRLKITASGDEALVLRARALPDGRIAAYSLAKKPRAWLLSGIGQTIATWNLDSPIEAAPVAVGGGVALPQSGRIRFRRPGLSERAVADFIPEIKEGSAPRWKFTAPVSKEDCIAVDERGTIHRIQYRESPARLAGAARLTLPAPVDYPVAVRDRSVFVADSKGKLRVLDIEDFGIRQEIDLPAPASNALWIQNDRLYVEVGRRALHCFDIGDELKARWTLPIGERSLAGSPQPLGEVLYVAFQDGTMMTAGLEDGKPRAEGSIGSEVGLGLRRLGGSVVAVSSDGSLFQVTTMEAAAEAGR